MLKMLLKFKGRASSLRAVKFVETGQVNVGGIDCSAEVSWDSRVGAVVN